jgi:hypothetical protein
MKYIFKGLYRLVLFLILGIPVIIITFLQELGGCPEEKLLANKLMNSR